MKMKTEYKDLEQHEQNLFNELDLRLLDYDRVGKKKVLIALLNKWGGLNE